MASGGRVLGWVVLCVAIAGLAGCSDSAHEARSAGATPTSRSADAVPAECGQVTTAQVSTLTGSTVVSGPRVAEPNGLPTCQWRLKNGATVQVVSQAAGRWARTLPAAVSQLRSSGRLDDASSARKLEDASALIKQGKTIAANEACTLFSSLLELQGLEAGSDYVVNLVPSAKNPQAITGQACIDGRFASVLWVSGSLAGSKQEVTRVQAALEAVIRSS